jgi:AcrR family transcriptional regulator
VRTASTSDRLLAAATELFARRGFHGTSIRQIAERAGANVAAGHYHYGSKRGLYLQVLRQQFAAVRQMLERRAVLRSPTALRAAGRDELVALLTARIAVMLDVMLGPPPQPHGALMLREMSDPTDALPIIVEEFVRPQMHEMEAVVARLVPRAGRATVQRAAASIVGQVLFYRFTMPVMLRLRRRDAYPHGFNRTIARHVVEFSLGGLARIGGTFGVPGGRRACDQRRAPARAVAADERRPRSGRRPPRIRRVRRVSARRQRAR